jgi:hypothetical protein
VWKLRDLAKQETRPGQNEQLKPADFAGKAIAKARTKKRQKRLRSA